MKETSICKVESVKPVPMHRRFGNMLFGMVLAIVVTGPAVAGPTGGEIVGGDGTITSGSDLTQINQTTGRIAINWDTFDVAANETVRFVQPTSSSVALNTIFDQNASQIFGTIDANGRVLLINPNGMIFSPTAQVNVAALVASSLNISTTDFMAGNYTFESGGGSGGIILNQGTLQAAPGGFIALLGEAVANEGLIIADAGTIAMGAGTKVALDFDGSGLIYFEVESEVLDGALGVDSAVSNSGSLFADGGQVLLTARAAQDVYTQAINNSGLIQARRIDNSGGVVRLTGGSGTVISTGAIDASGGDSESTGGDVELLGNRVGLLDNGSIDVSGDSGGGTVHLGGAAHGAGDLTAEFTQVSGDASIAADARVSGDGGEIIVWADDSTWFYGSASVTGGSASGNGGFVEISGAQGLSFAGTVDASAENGNLGTLLFDPTNITIRDQNDPDANNGADDGALPDLSNATAGAGDFEISETGLEGLAANANIVLEATNNITINSLVTDGELSLATTTAGSVTFSADTDGAGGGAFTMDTADSIVTQGGSLTISGAGVTAGNIDTSGPDNSVGGAVNLDATSGNLIVGNVATNGGDDVDDSGGNAAGNVTLAGQNINLGAITALGSAAQTGGNGDGVDGDVLITANGSVVVGGDLNVNAGQIDIFVDADEATTDGVESLTIQATLTAATINLDGGANTQNDSLVVSLAGADTATWTVNGANDGTLAAGSSDSATFTDFSDLDGGDQTDAFVVDGAGALAGSIDGAGGTNTLDVSTATGAVTVNLANSSATPFNGGAAAGFSNIDAFTGDNTSDTLAGPNGGATFSTSGENDGTVAGVTYTDFANITGGTGADTFNLNHDVTGTVDGGAGSDTIIGNDGGNAFVVNAANAGTANGIGFANIENLTGGALTDTFNFTVNNDGGLTTVDGAGGIDEVSYAGAGGPVTVAIDLFTSIETLTGSGNAGDTLQGTGNADAFTVDGANSGTAGGINYSDFENLDGLGGDDSFTLNVGGSVASITGGDDNDTIIGNDDGNAFVVNAANAGTANGIGFANIENLTGGALTDTFNFTVNNDGGLTTVDGAGGIDEVSYAGAGGPVTVAIDRFTSIETLTGSGNAGDTLQGSNGADAFTVDGANSGTAGGTNYSDFENLDGLGGNDSFTLNVGGSVASIAGGDDNDTIIGNDGGNTFVVNAANAGTANGIGFTGVENLTGGGSVDSFAFTGALTGTAAGLGGDDTFSVGDNGDAGFIDGGSGSDSLSYAASNSGVTINMAVVDGVESITGSSSSDTINLDGDEGNDITIVGGGGTNDVVAVVGNSDITGDLSVSDVDSVLLQADLGADNIDLSVDGAISQTAGQLSAQSLTASTAGGQSITDAAVSSFVASNSGAGDIELTNTGDLTIGGITQAGSGAVTVGTSGSLTQSADILSSGGGISITADGAITMAAGVETTSSGGDISYLTTGAGSDITINQLNACVAANCVASDGSITIESGGSIFGLAGQDHIQAEWAVLRASLINPAGDIGQESPDASLVIKFVGMDPNGDAEGSGAPIFLEFGGQAFIDEGLFSYAVSDLSDASNVAAKGQARAAAVSGAQAAALDDDGDVDWAAFSEEITIYEVNNDGVQLPQDQQTDEFAKLREKAIRELAEEGSVSDAAILFEGVTDPKGEPVSQLNNARFYD